MDFWERVARLLAEEWLQGINPYDSNIVGEGCTVDSLVEWAADRVETELFGNLRKEVL